MKTTRDGPLSQGFGAGLGLIGSALGGAVGGPIGAGIGALAGQGIGGIASIADPSNDASRFASAGRVPTPDVETALSHSDIKAWRAGQGLQREQP